MSEQKKSFMGEYIVQGLIIIATITLLVLINNSYRNAPHPLDDTFAPVFALDSINDEQVNIADHLGENVIVLDFFATWCPPCVKGLPVIDTLAKEFEPKGVKFYAVNVGETLEEVKPFIENRELGLTVLLDELGDVSDKYGVNGIPQTVIIGADGKVFKVHVGVSGNFEEELRTDIEEALENNVDDEPALEARLH